MSRAELADVVNTALDRLYPGRDLVAHYVDHRWVGKLERGEHRWPSEQRRAPLSDVLSALPLMLISASTAHDERRPVTPLQMP